MKIIESFKNKRLLKQQNLCLEKRNEYILSQIYDMGLKYHEGEFKPCHLWLESDIYTTFGGIQLKFHKPTKTFDIGLPPKFKNSFKFQILNMLKKEFEIISYNFNNFWGEIHFKTYLDSETKLNQHDK